VSTIEDYTRPRFVRGVRLQWDDIRKRHTLLFPEGALVLNPTAAAVLELCDGKRTVGAIVTELEERYQGASVANDVRNLLSRIAERGLLVHEDGEDVNKL
jgi:coenzyme PQQ biosynthesis protein PqqD